MSEKKILKNIQNGQQESIEILIEKYYRDIYTYCYCRVEDVQTAQDLTQDVFLKFLQNLNSYEHTGKLKNYLYVIAGNLIKDYYKKHREIITEDPENHKKKTSRGQDLYSRESVEQEPPDITDRLTMQEIVRTLSEPERELILLRYYQNLRLSEIAKIMDMPVSTVRYRLKQAEKYIRERWEESE